MGALAGATTHGKHGNRICSPSQGQSGSDGPTALKPLPLTFCFSKDRNPSALANKRAHLQMATLYCPLMEEWSPGPRGGTESTKVPLLVPGRGGGDCFENVSIVTD